MTQLSVVVPVYNAEKYIGKMIDSVIGQTLKDIELILVDDGSRDGSGAICDQYAAHDPRIRVLHKRNGGVSAARNYGLELATGEWVIFCDSDDWVETDALEKLLSLGNSTGADVVMGDMRLIYGDHEKEVPFFKSGFVTDDRQVMDSLIRTDLCRAYCFDPPSAGPAPGYGSPCNKLVRRALLTENNIRFDARVGGICDDLLYTAYVFAAATKVAYAHVMLYNYRQLTTSITNSFKPDMPAVNRALFLAWEEFFSRYGSDGRFDEAYLSFVIRRLKGLMGIYFFSARNDKPIPDQYRELRELLNAEPYSTAVARVNSKKLHNQYDKLLWMAARCGSPRLMRFVFRLSELAKRAR